MSCDFEFELQVGRSDLNYDEARHILFANGMRNGFFIHEFIRFAQQLIDRSKSIYL